MGVNRKLHLNKIRRSRTWSTQPKPFERHSSLQMGHSGACCVLAEWIDKLGIGLHQGHRPYKCFPKCIAESQKVSSQLFSPPAIPSSALSLIWNTSGVASNYTIFSTLLVENRGALLPMPRTPAPPLAWRERTNLRMVSTTRIDEVRAKIWPINTR